MPVVAPPHRRTRLAVLLSLVLVPLAGLVTPPAQAAPPPVGSLSPGGAEPVSGSPILSWARTADASRYRVEVSATDTFSPVLATTSTTSSRWVPTTQLPSGRLWWRVRVEGESTWSTTSFRHDLVAAPGSIAPTGGQVLTPPASPPLLDWSAVPGARSYQVEVSTDQQFVDPTKTRTWTTRSSSFVVPQLQPPNAYSWRVRADLGNGVTTEYSQTGGYRVGGLAKAEIQDPLADSFTPSVQDVDLDWKPVPGAATYDLQVSTDENFLASGAMVEERGGITSTRYAPSRTYRNDDYFWRVRPVDAAGGRSDWSSASTWRFRRDWTDQPALTYPADGDTVGDPFFFQWTGMALASRYELQVSPNRSFEPDGAVRRCQTVHTTYTPATDGLTGCMPAAGGTYYWRVKGLDGPGDVPTELTALDLEVRSFTYDPTRVTQRTPAPGATVSVPTFTWEPLAGAGSYQVTVSGPGGYRNVARVTGTSWTPPGALPLGKVVEGSVPERHEPASYTWYVQPVTEDGRVGAQPLFAEDARRFTLVDQPAATAARPDPTAATAQQSAYRFPGLAWSPVAGAVRYEVYVGPAGRGTFSKLDQDFAYPAGQDTGTRFLTPGTWAWFVRAIDRDGVLLARGVEGRFTVLAPGAVPEDDYRAALSGTTSTGELATPLDRCRATLPESCANLRHTPVLSWPADPAAGSYRLYVSRDAALTNLVMPPVVVHQNLWTPTAALPDSQAGSAYYWTVTPCSSGGICSPPTRATHAFSKLSRQVRLLDPVSGAEPADPVLRGDDVTLRWEDYLATQSRASRGTAAQDQDSATTLRTRSDLEAQTYRVQVSDDPNFAGGGVFTTVTEVDQRHLTDANQTWPEGLLYWRVQAVDGSGNPLAWSETGRFRKSSPAPACLAPSSVAVVGCPSTNVEQASDAPLTWKPVSFAAGYDVEVYANGDTVGQPVNRVAQASVVHPAISWEQPLPPSSGTYTWRVRRTDASGRKGAWSGWGAFTVRGGVPVLGLPASRAETDAVDTVFTWGAVDGAATYRFERRNAAGTLVESVDTPARAWSPLAPLPDGTGTWRVLAVDSSNRVLQADAEWRTFTVRGGISPTIEVSVTGLARVDSTLTLHPPTWDVESSGKSVRTTYQWTRNGTPISGATGTAYTLVPDDAGASIAVVATGTSPGYAAGSSTSNAIRPAVGPAVAPSTPPALTGNPVVSGVLEAQPGTWPTRATTSVQWLRDGAPVAGATGRSFTVTGADVGHALAVQVTATVPGYDPGQATSTAVRIGQVASSTTLTAPKKVPRKNKVTVQVVVTATGVPAPTGTVTILDGSRTVGSGTLGTGSGGSTSVRLKLKKGKHALRAVFSGSAVVVASTSPTRKVKVQRR